MALVAPPCSEIQKPRKSAAMIHKKPLLLKDFLMDDLSSCSSSGFKSFPRRQCCTTVRFLLDIDLKSSSSRPQLPPPKSSHNHNNFKNKNQKQLLRQSRSRAAASTTFSTLQRASGAVINAVRSLQFHSVKSSTSPSVQSSARKGGLVLLLPRSISRRLWTNSFREKVVEEEEKDLRRWRSFRELMQEEDKASDQTTGCTKSTDDSKTNSSSWRESEFSLNSSESSIGINDVAEVKSSLLPQTEKVSGRVGVTDGEDSIETPTTTTTTTTCSPQNAKVWLNKEDEKEQLSPVSVLDCPFEDEDDESSNSSPFRCRLARMEGVQHKFMQKIRRFENLAQLEPIDLDRRMAMTEVDDGDEQDNETEEETLELVKQLIVETCSSALSSDMVVRMKADKLVVDLFIDMIRVENSKENVVMEEVLKVAGEWVTGESQMLSSWEVENGRQVYVSDMDNKHCGKWMELDEQEKEVGLELEVEVWNSLLSEFLVDLVS